MQSFLEVMVHGLHWPEVLISKRWLGGREGASVRDMLTGDGLMQMQLSEVVHRPVLLKSVLILSRSFSK